MWQDSQRFATTRAQTLRCLLKICGHSRLAYRTYRNEAPPWRPYCSPIDQFTPSPPRHLQGRPWARRRAPMDGPQWQRSKSLRVVPHSSSRRQILTKPFGSGQSIPRPTMRAMIPSFDSLDTSSMSPFHANMPKGGMPLHRLIPPHHIGPPPLRRHQTFGCRNSA